MDTFEANYKKEKEKMSSIEIFGFCSTTVVLIAFFMKDIKLLRIFAILGSSMFATYGIILNLHPIIFTNSCIVIINIYKLIKKE